MVELTRERLADLLVDPNEGLDLEIKNWLDLANSNEDKATFAKGALAIANHGGGFIVLGSGLIDHIQKMTMAAMAMADMKVCAQRS